jgi:hypothetical protein
MTDADLQNKGVSAQGARTKVSSLRLPIFKLPHSSRFRHAFAPTWSPSQPHRQARLASCPASTTLFTSLILSPLCPRPLPSLSTTTRTGLTDFAVLEGILQRP